MASDTTLIDSKMMLSASSRHAKNTCVHGYRLIKSATNS